MGFGKLTGQDWPTQSELRVHHACKAIEKDDQGKSPPDHKEKVEGIREREYGKQTTGWGGGSDDVRKVK